MHHHANSLTNASTINVSFLTSKSPTCDRYQSTIFLFLAYQYLDNGWYIHSSLNVSTDPCVSTYDNWICIDTFLLFPFKKTFPKPKLFWPEPLGKLEFFGVGISTDRTWTGCSRKLEHLQVMVHGHVDILRLWVANWLTWGSSWALEKNMSNCQKLGILWHSTAWLTNDIY